MVDSHLTYRLDDRPPVGRLILYALQWTLLTIPILAMSANLTAEFLGVTGLAKDALTQRFCLLTGLTMLIQGLAGHRYPMIDGPAGALLLALITLAPLGEGVVRGSMLIGGLALALAAHLGLIARLQRLFTDNVVGVVVLLIAVTLLPYLLPQAIGVTKTFPHGQPVVAGLSLGLMFLIPLLGHRLTGFGRTLSVLIGLVIGALVFAALGRMDLSQVGRAAWLAWPGLMPKSSLEFSLAGLITGGLAYAVVLLNHLGSMAAIQAVVGNQGYAGRVKRGAAVTGWAGAAAGAMGVYGPVSYAYSPGVILATGVGSRWPTIVAGGMIILLGLSQKLNAVLGSVPVAVVAAVMVAAMASQIGSGIAVLTASCRELESRDYFVIGLPLLLGILASILGRDFLALLPAWLGPLLGNGLVVGMVTVLVLEHLLLRRPR